MPRIFKGTETLLKLFVPRVDEGNLETLKIALFTDDTNNAAEFYGGNMSIDGDTVYLRVNAWSFDGMNDGVLNYIAEIEIGEETIITERQSNYYLKTPNQYVPVGPDLSDYYTKTEIDEMLEDIEVDVDLTGYATEQWVEDKTYATEQYVNDAIANIDIPEGGSGDGESDCVVIQYVGDYTVNYDGEEVEYNYRGSERQTQNIDAIQRILNGSAKTVYYQYLHEQVFRDDEDGHNNKPTWLMMPMVYRYPSHDNIARFMGVINKDEWGGTNRLYAVGIMLRESDASIFQYNESRIQTGSGDADLSDYYTKNEIDTMIGDINNILETI